MLNWLFRRKRTQPDNSRDPAVPKAAAPSAEATPGAEQSRAIWARRLASALGDDAALLDLARAAPALDLKLAAVEALTAEAALKAAEREFRSHDRKVHQRARQRLAAAVALREARERAEALIAAASALAQESPLAANRLAALDRDWRALDANLLEPGQRDTFGALRDRLDDVLRQQDDARRIEQWSARAAPALASLELACNAGQADAIERCVVAVRARLVERPALDGTQALAQALEVALAQAVEHAVPTPTTSAPTAPLPPPAAAAPPRPAPPIAADKPRAGDAMPGIEDALARAEAALADGRTGELEQHLRTAEAALADLAPGIKLAAPLRARLQALHAERARLRGWQQWGGAVAREALVDEAEALSAVTASASAEASATRLDLKAHGDAIRTLRARWREIDRSGAASSPPLWQRFDAALTSAHAPVAAQQAANKSAREDNLAAREVLLAELAAAADRAASQRETLQALDDFQRAWRKLGPLQHTVPASAADALLQRHDATVSRIEAPLAEARAAAQREREAMIERAEALAALDDRDAVGQIRALQGEWQQHARALPLSRSTETALWARFRQASDAVFARRAALAQARDAESAAGLAAREALLERGRTIAQDVSAAPADSMRRLAELDRQWQQLFTPLPRAVADDLEARWRDVRAAAATAAESRRLAQWQRQCDALLERLALCELREAGAADGESLAQRWQAAGLAPAPWHGVLDRRWSGPGSAAAPAAAGLDHLLLQIEDALGVEPAPEQAQARRDLRLLAMKDALEGRSGAADPAAALAALLARPGLAPVQAVRLRSVLAAVRAAPQRFDGTA